MSEAIFFSLHFLILLLFYFLSFFFSHPFSSLFFSFLLSSFHIQPSTFIIFYEPLLDG